jgi:hypothetical protein
VTYGEWMHMRGQLLISVRKIRKSKPSFFVVCFVNLDLQVASDLTLSFDQVIRHGHPGSRMHAVA